MYHIDDDLVLLEDLKYRIASTDLVPSRASLLEEIDSRFSLLEQSGCRTLGDLRRQLRKTKIADLSKRTAIDTEYLVLLRREVESYFPKPFSIDAFDWIDESERAILKAAGLKNMRSLHDAVDSSKREEVARSGVSAGTIEALASLADLTRIQWTNPTAARMLQAAGYSNAKMVASADPEVLCEDLRVANEESGFFEGRIGLRDVRRLVRSASYLD